MRGGEQDELPRHMTDLTAPAQIDDEARAATPSTLSLAVTLALITIALVVAGTLLASPQLVVAAIVPVVGTVVLAGVASYQGVFRI